MEDSKALQYYDIKEGSSVYLILKPPEPQAAFEQRSQPANNTLQQYADLLHAEGALNRPRTEGTTSQRRERVVRIRFSDAEVSSLIEAVMEKGVGSWQHILHDPKYGFDARKRSAVDLKVRMRGLFYFKSTDSLLLDRTDVDTWSGFVRFHGECPFSGLRTNLWVAIFFFFDTGQMAEPLQVGKESGQGSHHQAHVDPD